MSETEETSSPEIAIVCDWLTNMGGAERVVLAMHEAFPDAPIFTSVFNPEGCPAFLGLDVRTTWLQKLPKSLRYKHQLWPVLRPAAFKKLDLKEYDIILSSASAEAKAVVTRKQMAMHICYCHSPIRYYWSHYEEYMQNPGFGMLNPLVRLVMPAFVRWMRKRDLESTHGVNRFIANSHEVQRRIKEYYNRDSEVIFPPVDTNRLRPQAPVQKQDYYLVVGRQIPYKRLDLAVVACSQLNKRLVVIGKGSEHEELKRRGGANVLFLENIEDADITAYFQQAKALIFPGREDFGITPVEALSAGTPVIAYKNGGALDYIQDGINGVFFESQTVDSLMAAIGRFEMINFDPRTVSDSAERFSTARFINELRESVLNHTNPNAGPPPAPQPPALPPTPPKIGPIRPDDDGDVLV
ncbi:glycosyltransferase [Candidatus Saccharibacteria bacterium]|nr:glycosyltransferase [Candidatus Saccharibacteria bacterium]